MLVDMDRRPFDRSRELGLKRARLSEDAGSNPNGRPFAQRIVGSAATTRFRGVEFDSNDSGGGGGAYEPRPTPQQQHHELISQYKTAIAELTFNSKPIITNLTIIAGENQHAAKAIAAIVCANILEVPSDQKLPSLYLLDSIVKNIGRDYIKYFAVRLPEVFCKAYMQVDPSVHQSMRHLFGTWKGVFPLQTLQIIEKELGFAPSINGSSSGSTTSRPDSQSQRPPHSIHVNPKYLERQCLQQSSRSVQHSNRDALSGSIHEKSIPAAYEDYECSSGFSQNSGLGTVRNSGKITDKAQDKHWYGTGSSVQETLSSQKNGFNVKPGLQNYSVSKNADPRLRAAHNIANRSNSGLSSSWKNSEEEEFMWDMHSRLSDQDAAAISSNSRKENWISNIAEKSEFGNHHKKTKSIHDVGSRFDREASAETEQKDETSYGSRISPAWSLQESDNVDGSIRPAVSTINSVNPEGYSATLDRLTRSKSSSLARMGARRQFGSSQVVNSGSCILASSSLESTGMLSQQHFQAVGTSSPPERSPMHLRSPLPSFPTRHPYQQTQNSTEEDYPQACSSTQPDCKPSQFPGLLNTRSHNHSAIQALSASLPRFGPSPKLGNMPNHSDSHAVEISGLSSTSGLLAAVMNSGILSKNSIPSSLPNPSGRQISSQSGVQPPLPRVDSKTFSDSACTDASAATKISPRKGEQPPLLPGPLSSSFVDSASAQPAVESKASDSNPLSNLLSSLVAKGLISASKTESQSVLPPWMPTQLQDKSTSISTSSSIPVSSVAVSSDTPCSSTKDDVDLTESAAKNSSSLSPFTTMEIENLIGLDFRPDVIREFHSSVINALLGDLSHQCSLCGLRLKLKEQVGRHSEWHAMRNLGANEVLGPSRRWYASSGDWIAGKPGQLRFGSAGCGQQSQKTPEKGEPVVPADENQCACILCGELFEDYFSQERGEWMFNGAVYMTIPTKDGEVGTLDESADKGPIVHSNCISESSLHDLGLATGVKTEEDVMML